MRIVGGRYGGRRLTAPKGLDTRPTADRTRESLFNILAHAEWTELKDARVLDAFCGSGALGLEALSRGAAHVTFMDSARRAIDAVRDNVSALREEENALLLCADATKPPTARAACTLVFLDPPYRRELAPPALAALLKAGWLAGGAAAVVEEAADAVLAFPPGFSLIDRRCYGDTAIHFVRAPSQEE